MYGKILSDNHLLNPIESELLVIGVLHSMQLPSQLRGHVKGANNVGATEEQIHALLALARAISSPICGANTATEG
jgi:alkylhydroperoxidase/carboxymuconolactone decarboxylase family protein YurZ